MLSRFVLCRVDVRARAFSTLDFLVRLAFFSTAPFAVVFAAGLFPLTGALVQVGLGLGVFLASEAVRRFAARSRLAAWALSGQLAFDDYYRAHPPRPFLYYVFYPLLAPYWLVVPAARREFLLYKGYTVASFGLLVASLAYQFETAFRPELTLRQFAPVAAGTLLVEAVVVLVFLMPIVTTVVHYHAGRASRRLGVLLLAAVVSISFAAVRIERRRDPIVSYATRARVPLRSEADPLRARRAFEIALHEAWNALPTARADVDYDGKVEGVPLERAHSALGGYFKNDEAYAFDLWLSRSKPRRLLVLYFAGRHSEPPVWLAMDRAGTATDAYSDLPEGAFSAMRTATR